MTDRTASAASVPTPEALEALAARLVQAITEVDAVRWALRDAEDGAIRRVGFRLDDGAEDIRQAAEAVAATARELAFIQAVRSRPHCEAQWGCCPEHGNTLAGTGGQCWCTAAGCGRRWDGRRMDLPCDESPAFRLIHQGKEILICAGHAAATRISGARLFPLTDGGEEG